MQLLVEFIISFQIKLKLLYFYKLDIIASRFLSTSNLCIKSQRNSSTSIGKLFNKLKCIKFVPKTAFLVLAVVKLIIKT